MTTAYSTPKSHEGISYRAKADYTITTKDSTVEIAFSVQMQYMGTYQDSSYDSSLDISTVAHNEAQYFEPPEPYQEYRGTFYTINASNFPKKTAWTNKGSVLSNTITLNKTESDRTVKVYFGVGGTGIFSGMSQIEVNVSVPALASWPVLYMPNNGSTTAFWQKTKYYNKNLYLGCSYMNPGPNSLPTRTGFIPRTEMNPENYFTAQIFNTSPDGTGQKYSASVDEQITGYADTYTANQALTLYLLWSSYINYDGNGISLSSYTFKKQTKNEGESIVLNANVPTRAGYAFKEWNTSADGTGDSYDPGDTYSQDVGEITLYAIWLTLPQKPQIRTMTAIRSNSQGEQDDTGTYAKISVDWSIDTTSEAYPDNTGTVTGTITPQSTGTAQSFTFDSGASGTSGTAIALIPNLSTDEQYTVTVTVTDQYSNTSKSVILTRAFFIMDFKAGGKGIGIGRAAPDEGLEIGYEATFDDNVRMYSALRVDGNLSVYGKVVSPKITGTPTAPTPPAGNDSTRLATTAFVKAAVDAGGGSSHGIPSGGSDGQILTKQSGTDYDVDWENPSSVESTDIPTANNIAEFDSTAHMNSEDMTSQEVDDFVDGLNINGCDLGDYVVEQGTSGIWTYRKWNSGIAECWGTTSATTSFTAWTAPVYYGTTYSPNVAFPTDLFVDTPVLEAFIKATGADVWLGSDSNSALNKNTTGRYYPLRIGAGQANTVYYVRFFAIGRWK